MSDQIDLELPVPPEALRDILFAATRRRLVDLRRRLRHLVGIEVGVGGVWIVREPLALLGRIDDARSDVVNGRLAV